MGEKPQFVKMIWQGTLGGKTARVVVSKLTEESKVTTSIEVLDVDTMGADRWVDSSKWGLPTQLATAAAIEMALVVEGLVDLVGRPDWDNRGAGTRHYPLEVKVVE